MVQTATAMLACGRVDTARRALVYLACTQQPDGGFAQNFWIDGTPYWSGLQLDEVAFPLMLAWRLWKADGLGEMDIFPFVERAAGFLVRHAPITHQERWEENAGYSPSTLAAVIAGLICAAEMARAHESMEMAVFLEEYADWIEGHLEDWTVTNNGVLHPQIKRHYMRIRPPECGEAYACESCGTEIIQLNNRPPGTRREFEAREIVDCGVSGAGSLRSATGRRSADCGFAGGGGCGAETRTAARARLAALQQGRLWTTGGRRTLPGLGPGPGLAAADRRARAL